jgi:hypothetical protein
MLNVKKRHCPEENVMSVLRGTFRLSIVVALLVAAYYAISAHLAAMDAEWEHRKLLITLRCGERFLGQDMSQYTNAAGLIDIGKAGCSNSSFWATFDEIRVAVGKQPPPPDQGWVSESERYSQVFWPKLNNALFAALAGFVVVNLGGLLFLGGRRVFRWILAGYR